MDAAMSLKALFFDLHILGEQFVRKGGTSQCVLN